MNSAFSQQPQQHLPSSIVCPSTVVLRPNHTMDQKAIAKAMEELKAMKENIAKLQKQKEDALKNVKAAQASIKTSEKDSAANSNYSNQGYWEDRYTDLNKQEPTTKAVVYEWYASYQEIEKYIREDVSSISSNAAGVNILVSGCGNSSLCEDLYHSGMTQVSGMDYSASAITLMQARAASLQLTGVEYFQADARGMPEIASGRYDVLLDKGTLDAIATEGAAGKGDNQVSVDAINYMLEVWRILKANGLLVLISTMPPEILEPLAIAPLSESRDKHRSMGSAVSNWKAGCRVQPITTAEGGTVYYYTIKKLANTARVTTFLPATKSDSPSQKSGVASNNDGSGSGSGSGSAAGSKPDDIMAGINALLEVARTAIEEQAAATKHQELAAREVQDVEHKRSALEKTLQTGIQDMGGGEGQELLAGAGGRKTSAGLNQGTEAQIQAAIENAVKALAPEVQVFVDTVAPSSHPAGEPLDVYYLLRIPRDKSNDALAEAQLLTKLWQEEDTLCLVARPALGSTGAGGLATDSVLYKAGDLPYEAFEYTEKPVPIHAASGLLEKLSQLGATPLTSLKSPNNAYHCLVGRVKMKVPTCAGAFHVSYIRTVTLPAEAVTLSGSGASTGKVVERRVKLAESSSFASTVPVLGAHPDARTPQQRVLFPAPRSSDPPGKPASNVRRRGAAPLNNSAHSTGADLNMWVEDMPNIKTFNLIAELAPTPTASPASRCLSRIMAWAVPSSNTEFTKSLCIYIEADIITFSASTSHYADQNATVSTVYGILQCNEELFGAASIDLIQASGQLESTNRFVIRFPYVLHTTLKPARDSGNHPFHTLGEQLKGDSQHTDLHVQCRLCKADVLRSGSIQNIRPLPTGLLDEMMHDFICCDLPVESSLETTSMTTPLHALMYGNLYASVHPEHLLPAALRLDCKAHSTILDISTSWGRAIATRGIATCKDSIGKVCAAPENKSREKAMRLEYLKKLRSAVNIETCAVKCHRCDTYLGDGYLEADGSADSATPLAPLTPSSAAPFNMVDLRDVRLALQNVSFSTSLLSENNQLCLSLEQMVTRAFMQLSDGHGFNSICLFVGDADLEKLDGSGAVEGQGIVMRLMSSSFRISTATSTTSSGFGALQVRMVEGVKVAFRTGEVLDVISGSEPRVPIQYHEFAQLKGLLRERAERMGPSPLKGYSLSYILK